MSNASNSKDSGPAFRWLVRLCGLAGLCCNFLPFFNGRSGYMVASDLFKKEISFMNLLTEFSGSETTTMSHAIGIFFMVVLLIFTAISIYMLISGRFSGGPVTILLVTNIAAWILLQFGGDHAGITESLFGHADFGYWAMNGALFTPFFGMFFLDKSV